MCCALRCATDLLPALLLRLGLPLARRQAGDCRCHRSAVGAERARGVGARPPPAQVSPPDAYRVRGRGWQPAGPRAAPAAGRAASAALPRARRFLCQQRGPTPGSGPDCADPRGFPLSRVRAVPAICSGRAGCRGLRGSPALRLARSTTSWSARQKRPSSRSANSSPGMSWRLQATQRKHSMWYTLARARITKSFLLKPMLHLAHLMPYNLSRAQPRKKEKGRRESRGVERGGREKGEKKGRGKRKVFTPTRE